MGSGTRTLAVDPLGALACAVGPLSIQLVPLHPVDAGSEWALGSLEVRPTSGAIVMFLQMFLIG